MADRCDASCARALPDAGDHEKPGPAADGGSELPAPRPTTARLPAAGSPGEPVPMTSSVPASCAPGTQRQDAGCVASALIEPCRVPWNVMHMEGGAYITSGVVHITDGIWSSQAWDNIYEDDIVDTVDIAVHFDRQDAPVRDLRDLELSAAGTGEGLRVRRYEGARRYPFSIGDRRPGFELTSTSRGCNEDFGWFEVHALAAQPGHLRRLLATFELQCDGLQPPVRGCVHYVDGEDGSDAGAGDRPDSDAGR
jgi:hypothetical protein